VLPALGVVETAGAAQFPENARRDLVAPFRL
jgi:hypothetical protein